MPKEKSKKNAVINHQEFQEVENLVVPSEQSNSKAFNLKKNKKKNDEDKVRISEEIIEDTSNVATKKQKKDKQKSELDVDTAMPSKTKKQKTIMDSGSIMKQQIELNGDSVKTRKQKKEKTELDSDSIKTNKDETKVDSDKVKTKKNKKRKTESDSDSVKTNKEDNELGSDKVKTKKNKKQKTEFDSDSIKTNKEDTDVDSNKVKTKKNKKRKTESDSDSVKTNKEDNELGSDKVKTKKNKKQKTEFNSDSIKTDKDETELDSDKVKSPLDGSTASKKAIKKCKKQAGIHESDSQLVEDKHKKKKSSPEIQTNSKMQVKEFSVLPGMCVEPSEDSVKENKKNKYEKKDQKLTNNSTDTSCIDSNSIKPIDHSTNTEILDNSKPAVQNQWKGNLFENADRQNKFLRLMGGMRNGQSDQGQTKKGLYGSLTSLCKKPESRGQIALSTSAAAELNQKLEEEYNKALNFKLTVKKGTGFGFTPDPAEGKKFHIDINKTKSVKFDDE